METAVLRVNKKGVCKYISRVACVLPGGLFGRIISSPVPINSLCAGRIEIKIIMYIRYIRTAVTNVEKEWIGIRIISVKVKDVVKDFIIYAG